MQAIKKLKKLLVFWHLMLALCLPAICLSAPQVIKIAILDNVSDPSLPPHYASSYIEGLQVAIKSAKEQGYTIEYKTFFYGNTPLAILDEVPQVNAWHPDLIIGPHSSNQFLLLRKSFNNILVITPYASDPEISNLPDNFYSLDLLDQDLAHIMVKFISGEFPNTNLVNVVNATCKDCVDINSIITSEYGNAYPAAKIITNMYSDDTNYAPVAELIKGYQPGDIILPQPDTYVDMQQLMYRIANHLGNNPIFVTILDNLGDPSKIAKSTNYTEYWFTPYLFDDNSPNFQAFTSYYSSLFGCFPENTISYTIYLTIASVTQALKQYPSPNKGEMRTTILSSYNKARAHDPHWYKNSNYAIYKIDSQETKLIGTISAFD